MIERRSRAGRLPDAGTAAAFLIPFGLIVFLGMKRGGYEQPTFSEVGIAAWWLVAAGIAVGAFPSMRVGRTGWIGLALIGAFAAWTALGITWSESSGRSVVEVVRMLTYVGVLAVALMIGGRERMRVILGAVAAGCAVIAAIALLSRLEPSWFPDYRLSEALDGVQSRLAYPIGYWNALAGVIAIGLPLLLWAAASARSIPLRGLAAAAVPVVAVTAYFTFSRGGLIAAAAALLALIALSPRRLALVLPCGVMAAGGAVVVWQASIRHQLADGLTTETAGAQGERMILIVAIVALAVGLAIAGLALLERRGRLPRPPLVPRRPALAIAGVAAVIGLIGFVGLGGPRAVSDGFEEFKQPVTLSETSSRLESIAGNGRWQYWSAAADAGADSPLHGIGPGTFGLYWIQNRDFYEGFIRDAHSLWVEVFAELGVVGLLLLAGFVLFVVGHGVRRLARAAEEQRAILAAAVASAIAFIFAAGADWLWEIAVVPVAFLFVAAVLLTSGDEPPPTRGDERTALPLAARIVLPLVALGAIAVIALPWRSDLHFRQSQADFRAGDYRGALAEAESAVDLQPYAAQPRLQVALVHERLGHLAAAASAAREAVDRESTNWENWYVLASIQSQRPEAREAARRSLNRAQELNPADSFLNP